MGAALVVGCVIVSTVTFLIAILCDGITVQEREFTWRVSFWFLLFAILTAVVP